MGNIPNTNTPNLILQSVGNGSNDSRWGTSGGGSTLPSGTALGQMIQYNGTAWVITTAPTTTGQILQWSGSAWVPVNFPILTTSATNAQILIYNGTNWVNKTVSSDVTITNAGVATVAKIQGNAVLGGVPTTGQVLTWNAGGYWAPATSAGGPPTGAAGGALTGTYPNPNLSLTGVVAASYGSSTQVPQISIGSDGRIASASNVAISVAPSGSAGGDLSGTYPNPTVAKIKGTALGTLTSAVNGNALIWSTPLNSWVAANPTFGGYTVNMGSLAPTTDNGTIPYFSNVGAVNQFIPGPVPTLTGHYYSWNTSPSGHWEILPANPGGALSNQGWSSTSIIPASGVIPITTPGKMVEVTGIIGFSSYLIGFDITAKNGDATTGRNLNAYIYQSGSSVAQSQQFMVANQIGSTSVSYLVSGSSSTTYSFAGYAYVGGATTGTANFATITVLGIA